MRSGLVTVARQRAGDAVRSQLRLQASLVAVTQEIISERVRMITDVVDPKHVVPLLEMESSSSVDHAWKFSMDFGTIDLSPEEIFDNSNLYSLASASGSLFKNSDESKIRSRMNADSFGQMSLKHRSAHLHNALKAHFGHAHFRPGQFEVIDALLRRQHCVAILPTGHGKSLCYQLPSLVTGKPTLVISPLIALMQEQATSLKLKGIDAEFSGKGDAHRQDWEELDVLFMSPEAAILQRERLEMTDFGLIAVDEAHCVSEWGSGFRPTYRDLGFLRQIHPEVPHLLITATATEMVANDIRSVFNLKEDEYKQVTHSFNRHNLHYSIRELDKKTPATILKMVRDAEAQNEVTIIYTLTVDECNRAHEALKKGGVTAGRYNGPMNMTDRMNEQEKFMSGEYNTIVCTVAFGMGIDKPNVRHVIHYGRVKSMTDYYQQTGRAGRDGLAARCTLFINPANMVSKMSFVLQDKISPVFEEAALQEMLAVVNFCELDERICRRVPLLAHFGEKYTVPAGGCGACDHCDVDYVYKGKPVDIAFIAVAVLELFHNARSALPTMMAVTTLKGSQSGKVEDIPGFGAAKDLSVEMITEGMMQLKASGYLSRDVYKKKMTWGAWMGWSITEKGEKWYSGRSKKKELLIENPRVALLKVMAKDMNLPEVKQYENERSKAAEAARRTLGADLVGGRPFFPLFESLKALRQGQAESTGVSAGQLLNDSIVQALCRIRPSNVDAFRRVPGVPGLVADSPAQEYVDAIISFCSIKGYPTDVVDTFGAKLAAEAAQKMLEFERQDPLPAVVLSNAKTFSVEKPDGKRRVMS